jgi:hypothetical protein
MKKYFLPKYGICTILFQENNYEHFLIDVLNDDNTIFLNSPISNIDNIEKFIKNNDNKEIFIFSDLNQISKLKINDHYYIESKYLIYHDIYNKISDLIGNYNKKAIVLLQTDKKLDINNLENNIQSSSIYNISSRIIILKDKNIILYKDREFNHTGIIHQFDKEYLIYERQRKIKKLKQ